MAPRKTEIKARNDDDKLIGCKFCKYTQRNNAHRTTDQEPHKQIHDPTTTQTSLHHLMHKQSAERLFSRVKWYEEHWPLADVCPYHRTFAYNALATAGPLCTKASEEAPFKVV